MQQKLGVRFADGGNINAVRRNSGKRGGGVSNGGAVIGQGVHNSSNGVGCDATRERHRPGTSSKRRRRRVHTSVAGAPMHGGRMVRATQFKRSNARRAVGEGRHSSRSQ